MTKNRRGKIFANKLHKDMFFLIFLSAVIPTMLTAIVLFYLIFYVTADQFGVPEAIYFNLFPAAQRVVVILLTSLPVVLLVILAFAHDIAHKVVGPFDRIIREMDDVKAGRKKDRICLRPKDKFLPLVERINAIIDCLPSNK